MGLAFARHGSRARRRVVHRRGRIVARRVARSDQPVRRAAAAGDLLPAEQPDGALDAGPRAIRRARVRRQGRRLRHSRASRSTAPIRTRSRRRSPGRPNARARARARRSSSSSRCACAATRITTTCCISARIRSRRGTTRRSRRRATRIRELYEFWRVRDPIPTYAARSKRAGVISAGDLDRMKREAEAMVEAEARAVIARAVAGCRDGDARRHRRRSRRSRDASRSSIATRATRGRRRRRSPSKPRRRSTRRARRFSTR